jgi:hypothetical protein
MFKIATAKYLFSSHEQNTDGKKGAVRDGKLQDRKNLAPRLVKMVY